VREEAGSGLRRKDVFARMRTYGAVKKIAQHEPLGRIFSFIAVTQIEGGGETFW
jgi:hypothetical protein